MASSSMLIPHVMHRSLRLCRSCCVQSTMPIAYLDLFAFSGHDGQFETEVRVVDPPAVNSTSSEIGRAHV